MKSAAEPKAGGAITSQQFVRRDQAKLAFAWRRRIARPTMPKPPTIIAQLAGSGTLPLLSSSWIYGTTPEYPPVVGLP
jgi:hypothetical protein